MAAKLGAASDLWLAGLRDHPLNPVEAGRPRPSLAKAREIAQGRLVCKCEKGLQANQRFSSRSKNATVAASEQWASA